MIPESLLKSKRLNVTSLDKVLFTWLQYNKILFLLSSYCSSFLDMNDSISFTRDMKLLWNQNFKFENLQQMTVAA